MFQREPGIKALRPRKVSGPSLTKRRAWYADGDNDTVNSQSATDTQPVKKGSGGQENGDAKFTQADLDLYLGNARKQARDSVMSDLLKEFGLEKPDDLKTLVTSAKQREDAEKTELEKRDQRIAALEKEAEDAKAAAVKAQQERMEERRQAAILSALKDAKKPNDLLILVNARMTEAVAATMTEDGALDDKKLGALVEQVKKEWPDQFQSASPGSPSNAGGKPPQPDAKRKEEIRKSIRVRY